jgi:parvulin-like peptidyl-prolyl isomerase
MLEIILLISLGINGWQAHGNGELSQNNKQLSQTVVEQSELVDKYYGKIGDYAAAALVTEKEIKHLYSDNQAKAIEMEKLRNSDTVVASYLRAEIPDGLILILQASDED